MFSFTLKVQWYLASQGLICHKQHPRGSWSEYECCVYMFFKLGIFSNTSQNLPMRFCFAFSDFLIGGLLVYPNGISIITVFFFPFNDIDLRKNWNEMQECLEGTHCLFKVLILACQEAISGLGGLLNHNNLQRTTTTQFLPFLSGANKW